MLAAAALACAAQPGPAVRAQGPPPSLAEIPEERMRGTMGRLSVHVQALDRILQQGRPASPAERDALWQHLEDMEAVLDELGPGARDPSHPQFGWRLDSLRRDVRLAQVAVGSEPPEYYLVGTLTGSCTYCHAPRR